MIPHSQYTFLAAAILLLFYILHKYVRQKLRIFGRSVSKLHFSTLIIGSNVATTSVVRTAAMMVILIIGQ
jgi:hypothetical protein